MEFVAMFQASDFTFNVQWRMSMLNNITVRQETCLISRKHIRAQSKLLYISILITIVAKLAQTPFKLQMFGGKMCHVRSQLEHIVGLCWTL